MTFADQIEAHEERCQRQVLRLWMLARDEMALPGQAAAEIIKATDAILAEAEEAGRDAHVPAATLLSARLSRLALAAGEVIAAAGAGDYTQLRRNVARFESLNSAIWTVRRDLGPETG